MRPIEWVVPAVVAALVTVLGLYLIERRAAQRIILSERKRHEHEKQVLVDAHAAQVTAIGEARDREIDRLVKAYDKLLDTQKTAVHESLRLATTAFATPQEARVEDRTPDAFERAQSAPAEATINRGVEVLRDAYRALGVTYSDEELREEAELLFLTGTEARFPDLGIGSIGVPDEARQ